MSEWKTRITKVQVVKPTKEAGEACLVLIYPPGPDMGKRFPLARSEVVLGRGADCDIQVDRDSVSRRHARVFRDRRELVGRGSAVDQRQLRQRRAGHQVRAARCRLREDRRRDLQVPLGLRHRGELPRRDLQDDDRGRPDRRPQQALLPRVPRARDRPLRALPPPALAARCSTSITSRRSTTSTATSPATTCCARCRAGCSAGSAARSCSRATAARSSRRCCPRPISPARARFGEQIRRLVGDQPFEYEGDTFPVTVSVGVATRRGRGRRRHGVHQGRRRQPVRAKREGRNRVVG